EPARTVDAHEARDALAARRAIAHGHLGEKLRPERAIALVDPTALARDLGPDLLARLVPQPHRARRRERLHLQRRLTVVERDGDDALRALLDLEAQVHALARHDLDAADVDVRPHGVRLARIERPVFGAVRRRR